MMSLLNMTRTIITSVYSGLLAQQGEYSAAAMLLALTLLCILQDAAIETRNKQLELADQILDALRERNNILENITKRTQEYSNTLENTLKAAIQARIPHKTPSKEDDFH